MNPVREPGYNEGEPKIRAGLRDIMLPGVAIESPFLKQTLVYLVLSFIICGTVLSPFD